MQPEILVQIIQLGAMGLLGFLLWNIMKQGQEILTAQSETLKSLIEGNQRLMEKLIDALLRLTNGDSEQVVKGAERDFSAERSGTSQKEKSVLLTTSQTPKE
jgi:predicted PurR-regulated permease PerM